MTQQEKMIRAIRAGVDFDNAAVDAGAVGIGTRSLEKVALFRKGPAVCGCDADARVIPRWEAKQVLAQQ